jgi:hypothetical protein
VQTESPPHPSDTSAPSGSLYTERYHYDGLRRVQTVSIAPGETEAQLVQEYVWGPGDQGFDELLMLFDGHALADRETAWWPLLDSSGDVVALCDVDGSTPRVVGQWSYEPYGQAVAAESIHAHPQMKLGHKGLFLDRLDLDSLSPGTGGVWPTLLAPFSDPIYQMRNRDNRPQWGRFVQRDPNQSGQTVLMGSYHGEPIGAPDIAFSLEALYTDGHNLYQYLGSNPLNGSDPYGLFGIMGGLSTGLSMFDTATGIADMGLDGVQAGMSLGDMLSEYSYNLDLDVEWAGDLSMSDSDSSRGGGIAMAMAGTAVMRSHHIASNKHASKFTAIYEEIFASAGMTLEDPANKMQVLSEFHKGRHPLRYHMWVQKNLEDAVFGLDKPQQRASAIRRALNSMQSQIEAEPGRLHATINGKKTDFEIKHRQEQQQKRGPRRR